MKFSELTLKDFGNEVNLIGAIYAGKGHAYSMILPNESLRAVLEPVDMTLEDWEKLNEQTDSAWTEILAQDKTGLVKILTRKCERQIDANIQWKCFKRDKYSCCYCGANDCPLTVDHLITWESNGPTIPENLLTACKQCNRLRGNMDYRDWLESAAYKTRAQNLDMTRHQMNWNLESTLSTIPLKIYIKNR